MAEFKVHSDVESQISAFKSAGNSLNDGFSATDSSGVSSLTTAVAYIAEQSQLKTLMALYASLVAKDAADLDAMVAAARAADQAASGNYTT